MPGVVDPGESFVGDPLFDPLAIRCGKDLIVAAPQQGDGNVDGVQQMLVVGSVGRAELSVLR